MMCVQKRLTLAVALALMGAGAHAATITVNSNDDSAASTSCNLRDAVQSINGGAAVATCAAAVTGTFGSSDTIVFDPTVAGSTITLTQGQLSVTNPLTISGTEETIDAAGASRIFAVSSSLSASNLLLVNGTYNGSGGAIDVNGAAAQLNLTHVTVSGSAGISTNGGGVIGVRNAATLNLGNSKITGNSSTGIVISGSTATVTGSTISNNAAACGANYCAAGLLIWKSTLQVTGSTLSGNVATGGSHSYVSGGAYIYDSTVSLTNCTVTGNSADATEFVAGGLSETHQPSFASAALTVTNSTVSANGATTANATAAYVVGGILDGAYQTGSLTLGNAIVAANSAAGNGSPANDFATNSGHAPVLAFTYSLLGSALNVAPYNTAANNNQFSDTPGLGPLANNGGPTLTMALQAGSLAIDTGSNALVIGTTDQTGFTRIYNGTVDIGAFEFPGDHIFGDGFE